jgi:hypothetical protein
MLHDIETPQQETEALQSVAQQSETEGPRRRLWISLLLCAYALVGVALDQLAKATNPDTIAVVTLFIYLVFSPVVWIAIYLHIADW